MIIGITGKAGSGKDTVGRIIQYLIGSHNEQGPFDGFRAFMDEHVHDELSSPEMWGGGFRIKKYAGKVKEIACILLGCTMADWENDEFKNGTLGPEWNRTIYHVRTDDNVLSSTFYEEDALLDEAHYDDYYHGGTVYIEMEDTVLTRRMLLQLLGTDCGRDIIHPQIWVNALMSEYKSISDTLLEGEVRIVRESDLIYPNWVITDVRFPNEVKAIEDRGGFIINLSRDYDDSNPKYNHRSENSLDDYVAKYNVDNNGTIEELMDAIFEILIGEIANKVWH